MKILVQKFGGTSVATQERRDMAAKKIEAAIVNGFKPVIVVSAIGRNGDPYATDTLLNFASSVSGDTEPRELDLMLSCGEIISCVMLSNTIRKNGYECKVLTGWQGGIITDDCFGDAEVLRIETKQINDCVEKNIIPIIAGFQGITERGDVTTLGRGAGDFSAAIIGEALEAETVEIYTDVDGIMTADPRIVPDAKMMNTIYYNEVFQMAEYGAKVVHPRAIEIAMRSCIPIIIRNTMSDSPGTLITNYDKSQKYKSEKKSKIVSSVAYMNNRVQVKINYDEKNRDYEKDNYLFSIIAEKNISIDMINVYPESKVFIIHEKDIKKLEKILNEMNLKYDLRKNCSKVTVIGNKMRGVPGVMAKVLNALSKQNIHLLQTSDSHTTISCLIDSNSINIAVNALHCDFELGKSCKC